MIVKPKTAVYLTVQDYRDGRKSAAKCRTIYGTTADEFLRNVDKLGGKPESPPRRPKSAVA